MAYPGKAKLKIDGKIYRIKHIDGGGCHTCALRDMCFNETNSELNVLVKKKKLACLNGNLPYSYVWVEVEK